MKRRKTAETEKARTKRVRRIAMKQSQYARKVVVALSMHERFSIAFFRYIETLYSDGMP